MRATNSLIIAFVVILAAILLLFGWLRWGSQEVDVAAPSRDKPLQEREIGASAASPGATSGNPLVSAEGSQPAMPIDSLSEQKAADAAPPNVPNSNGDLRLRVEELDSRGSRPPFEVSESVRRNCLRDAAGKCDDQMLILVERMNNEPREEPWADQVELRLKRLIELDGNFEIRRLECRTTVCAMEITSRHGAYLGSIGSDEWLNRQISLADRTNGYESGPDGTRNTVTLGVYERR